MTVYTQTESMLRASGCPEGAIELWQFVANWSLKEHIQHILSASAITNSVSDRNSLKVRN